RRRTGRDLASIGLVVGAVTVVDRDGAAARQWARREAALYISIIAQLDHSLGLEPELLQRINEASARYDYEAVGRCLSDELLRHLAFAGTPDEVAQQAADLFAAGANRVEFGTPHGLDPAQGMRLLGEQVLPALQKVDGRRGIYKLCPPIPSTITDLTGFKALLRSILALASRVNTRRDGE
ncbi:MAG: LLM class flavin-dependent oxidoreductase, partial [Anaerolineales bacterium]|nr:LLM class flavin-dependent oxidoreductase [Anaerolineales bacterium]